MAASAAPRSAEERAGRWRGPARPVRSARLSGEGRREGRKEGRSEGEAAPATAGRARAALSGERRGKPRGVAEPLRG